MRKIYLLALSSALVIGISTASFARAIPAENKCKALMTCIIEKTEAILANLPAWATPFDTKNSKLVHALAKQCKTTQEKINFGFGLLNQEIGLAPGTDSVQQYLLGRFKEGIENGKVYEETATLENESFKTKLYVEDFEAASPVKRLQFSYSLPPTLETQWKTLSGKSKPEPWWLSSDSIFYSIAFEGRDTSFGGGKKEKAKGFLILERLLDIHTVTEECVSGK